jgi:hypothetical protein
MRYTKDAHRKMQLTTDLYMYRLRLPCYSEVTKVCEIWGFHGGDYEEYRFLGSDAMWLLYEPNR